MSDSKKHRSSDSVRPSKPGESQVPGGYEKSAEQDESSNQAPGVHSAEVERRIGRNMPDRK